MEDLYGGTSHGKYLELHHLVEFNDRMFSAFGEVSFLCSFYFCLISES